MITISEQKNKSLGCKSKLSTYITVHEIARQAGISPSDWLNQIIEYSISNGIDVRRLTPVTAATPVNSIVTPNYLNQIETIKPKNKMELNDSPTRAELKIDKLENEIEKLSSKNTELSKIIETEKKRADTAELKYKAEEEAHSTTKKQIPSDNDLQLLYGSKADNILYPLIEKNSLKPIFADSQDLSELDIHPMLYENLRKAGQKTETTNVVIEKVKTNEPEEKPFKICSKHAKN